MKKQPLIDLKNYEVFVIDYLDGQLSKAEETALLAFLDQHPDLKDEFEGLELATLEPLIIEADFKQELKKIPVIKVAGIDETNYETYFIASAENDLNNKETEHLNQFLSINPMLHKEFELHQKLRLEPDTKILFPGKSSLKKRKVIPLTRVSSVAAGLAFLLAISFFLRNQPVPKGNQIILQSYAYRTTRVIPNKSSSSELIVPRKKQPPVKENVSESKPATNAKPPVRRVVAIENQPLAMTSLPQKPLTTELVDIYDFEKLSIPDFEPQTMMLADAGEVRPGRKSLFSRIVGNQVNKFKDRLSGSREDEINRQLQRDDPGYIRVIDRSILVFNTITGSETNVEKTYNSSGHLTDYNVSGHNLYVSRPVETTPGP
ncbi:MAG: hypothetical protein A2W85_01980 [Bacteroidetes bacterium GWF2_41_31]|nr:MAG: hypothetical protein A2W85_01980 [Bacteroidetes bacterium GWF2_41_31]